MQRFWTTRSTGGRLVRDAVVVSVSLLFAAGIMVSLAHHSRKEIARQWLSWVSRAAAAHLTQHLEEEVQRLHFAVTQLESTASETESPPDLSCLSDYVSQRGLRGLMLVDGAGRVEQVVGDLRQSRIRVARLRPVGTGYADLSPMEGELAGTALVAVRWPSRQGEEGRWLIEVLAKQELERELGLSFGELRLTILGSPAEEFLPERELAATAPVPQLGVEIRAEATGTLAEMDTVGRVLPVVGVFVFLGAFLLFSALRSRKRIVDPLRRCVEVAKQLAEGDLSVQIEAHGDEEVREIFAALEQIREKFREVIGRLKMNVSSLSAGSEQLAAASQDLSRRVQEQASIVQQSRATFEEMREGISKTAGNAQEARERMTEVSRSIENVAELGEQANRSLEHFIEHAKEMGEITQLVDEMAFQTKLLALNAAVEAARAGEQGRGFAVVAGEIRNLAQRSAEGARRIQEIVETTLKEMEGAIEQARSLGTSVQAISESRERVVWLVEEIAAEMEEQAAAIRQLNTAVSRLDEVAQQNAAFVEELASSSEELAASAEELQEEVEFFRLEESAPIFRLRQSNTGGASAKRVRRVDRFHERAADGQTMEVKELTEFEEF